MLLLPLVLAGFLRKEKACLGIADGFSRVGCYQDGSPDSVRISYRDAVDNGMVPGWNNQKMGPDRCFQFCRDKPTSRFFLIAHGTDCYCAEYYHDISTGGGTCDFPCESDTKEMCGGKVKASVFEMHTCGNTMDLAATAANSALENGEHARIASEQAAQVYGKIMSLADSWQLPICSKAPGLCALRAEWEDHGQQIYDAGLRAGIAANNSVSVVSGLHAAQSNASRTAEDLLAVENGVKACREAMSDAATKATVVEMALAQAAGPLKDAKELPDFSELYISASANAQKGWTTMCDLVPLEGRSMLKVGAPDPAGCGDVCLDEGDDCVGFNMQAKDGIFACQLLSSDGVFEQDDSLKDAYGVFEFSNMKVEDMGLDASDCYLKQAFKVRNGGLDQEVLEQVFVAPGPPAEETPAK